MFNSKTSNTDQIVVPNGFKYGSQYITDYWNNL